MSIKNVMNEYYEWLKNETVISNADDGFFEITAPFLDNANDYIQLYAKINGNILTITDDGYYVGMLESYGMKIEKSRLRLIELICKSNGVKFEDNKILTSFSISNESNYQLNVHKMIQTVLKVDDLHFTSNSRVKSYFLDDVIEFLESKEINYSSNLTVYGKTGLPHTYEIHFQKTREKEERFAKVINNLTKQSMTNTLFMWADTQENRPKKSKLIVIANDLKEIDNDVITGLSNYGVELVKWSQRDNSLNLLG